MTLHIQDISTLELQQIGGGDWYETTWGILLGTGFAAGFLGSGRTADDCRNRRLRPDLRSPVLSIQPLQPLGALEWAHLAFHLVLGAMRAQN